MNTACENDVVPSGFCIKVHDAVIELKDRLQARYESSHPGRTVLIHRAIEQAEVLAWKTSFPHLFLPNLAEERIASLALAS